MNQVVFSDLLRKSSFLRECVFVKSDCSEPCSQFEEVYILCNERNDVILDKQFNMICFEDHSNWKKFMDKLGKCSRNHCIDGSECKIIKLKVVELHKLLYNESMFGIIIKKV